MFNNYLKVTLRNLKKNTGFSVINITGLALGLAISFILFFYVLDDLLYDRFHEKADSIYRILSVSEKGTRNAITAGPLVQKVKDDVPEIIASTRLTSLGRVDISRSDIESDMEERNSISGNSLITDPGFFEVFSFPLISGTAGKPLTDPNGIYLFERFAQTLFGEDDPLGKRIELEQLPDAYIAGIVADPPAESHINFDFIIPLNVNWYPDGWNSWENLTLIGYVLVSEGASVSEVEQKMTTVAKENNFYELFEPRLQPLLDVHLGSSDYYYDFINDGKNDRKVVTALAIVGIVVLLIACFNFINLSTARASKRAREVGMRKISGADKKQIAAQFLGESVIVTVAAFLIALFFIKISVPFHANILGKYLDFGFLSRISEFSLLFGVSILIGIISGIYPAFVISSFQPVKVLKGELRTGNSGIFMRRLLIIMQFSITITLVIAAISVYAQIEYLKSLNLGYDRNRLVAVRSLIRSGDDLLSERISNMPEVVSTGRINALPAPNFYRVQIIPEGTDRKDSYTASQMEINETLFNTFSISISEGRNFSRDFALDTVNSVIVNRTLAEKAGWSEPIGKNLDVVDGEGRAIPHNVIGVIDDFHYLTPRQAIEPMLFLCNWRRAIYLTARLDQSPVNETIKKIENIFKEVSPDREFRYYFLDEIFDGYFDSDRYFGEIVGIFSGIAIFIACLGLIGLASYTIEQRRKEIVIRKVLGSNRNSIVYHLSSEFLKYVVIANLLAWPAAYFAVQVWLDDFAYKMSFSPIPSLIAGGGAVLIALSTILYQTMKVASSNPTDSLQYE